MKQRGKRIRPSDKDLVFHFTLVTLLPVSLLVVGLFHVKTIQQINWQDLNLSQADKINIPFMSLWLVFMMGMRIGEATAVQCDDLNFETGVLSIDKTLYYKNQNDYRFTEPKTKASIRHIVLDKITLILLKKWKNAQQKVVKTDYIMSYNGMPTQKHTIAYAIERYAKKAGDHRIRIHELRHS